MLLYVVLCVTLYVILLREVLSCVILLYNVVKCNVGTYNVVIFNIAKCSVTCIFTCYDVFVALCNIVICNVVMLVLSI